MSMTDPIADTLTRIRNGHMARKARVHAPASKLKKSLLGVLKENGYIVDFFEFAVRPGIVLFDIELRYHEGQPAIKEISKVTKPGRRVYASASNSMELPGAS